LPACACWPPTYLSFAAAAADTVCFHSPHYYQAMAKEADKQWPSKNKKLDWMLALAHGT
jgi:hypothetical protein